jgi:VIT1/CCC1 family predicted Fe2+/Mn2+ transporter
MKRIILFIIMSINLCAFEVKDNIGIFDESSKKEFEKKIREIENKSRLNFIFDYDLSKKVINLKDNKKTILIEIIKKEDRKTDVNLYISNDLNISKEILDKAVNSRKDLIENGKYREYSYEVSKELGKTGKNNSLLIYFFAIISFIFLYFIVKYSYKGFRANRFRKEEESPDFTEQGGS